MIVTKWLPRISLGVVTGFVSVCLPASAAGGVTSAPTEVSVFPEIDPYESGYLRVSDLHEIYYELCGNPQGRPVFVLHGGPGGGCSPRMRRYFDPTRFLIVLHDQRGAGRSRPSAETRENTTQDLVEDIERLRRRFNLGKIVVFGGSWGSTLGLAYAETHPEHVSAMVLRGLWLCTPEELAYWYGGGVASYFPEEYEKLMSVLPPGEPGTVPERLLNMLRSDDPATRQKAARAWAGYEIKLAYLNKPDPEIDVLWERWDPYDFAVLENFYMVNNCFLKPGQLMDGVDRLRGIPITVVNGRYDVICPPITAYRFCRRLTNAKLVIVEAAGHSQGEPGISSELVKAMKALE